MSITDELREWMKGSTLSSWTAEHLTAIADRIDAEHKRVMAESNITIIDMTDESMGEHGWVRLPKDADGEYIHVGDVMEACYDYQLSSTLEVRAMRYGEGGWEVYDRLGDRYHPSSLRHHHVPTVEDVLREMLYKAHIYDEREMELLPDLIADYAKRLTLAEGEDA